MYGRSAVRSLKTLLAHLSINIAFSKVCKCKKFMKYGTCEFNKGFLICSFPTNITKNIPQISSVLYILKSMVSVYS